MPTDLKRDPKKLCGMPYRGRPGAARGEGAVSHDEQASEDHLAYCLLRPAHRPPHVALLWWFDPPEGDTDA